MRISKRTRGFSLIEATVVFVLAGILLGLALPGWRHFGEQNFSQASLRQLSAALQFARQQALLRREVLALCPSQDQRTCSTDWQGGFIVFRDPQEQGRIEEERQIIRVFQLSHLKGSLHWRAFPHPRPYCQFLPSGLTRYENGTFWYCPPGSLKPDWALALSQAGRIREVEINALAC